MTDEFQLTERARRWIASIRSQFSGRAAGARGRGSGDRDTPASRSCDALVAPADFALISEDAPGRALAGALRRGCGRITGSGICGESAARPADLSAVPARARAPHAGAAAGLYEQLCELAGGGDSAGALPEPLRPAGLPYRPARRRCWQGDEPLLVRNYDYSPRAVRRRAAANALARAAVLGMSDCLSGLLDGINDAGLAVSLTFGGRRVVGDGFGVPIILRYVLETCETVARRPAVLPRVPCHMAYNVTLLDAAGDWATVYLGPDRKRLRVARDRRDQPPGACRVGHPCGGDRVGRARALAAERTGARATLARGLRRRHSCGRRSIRSPSSAGFGTLYTAVYSPSPGCCRAVTRR